MRECKKLNILLTNDDGIHAEGISVAREILEDLGHTVYTVAPDGERSSVSSAMTFGTFMKAKQIDNRTYALSGTPVDCVVAALSKDGMLKNIEIDCVVSGINDGMNIGNILPSGTIAAAIRGAIMNKYSIALSQYRDDQCDFTNSRKLLPKILGNILDNMDSLDNKSVLNINVPYADHPKDIKIMQREDLCSYAPIEIGNVVKTSSNIKHYMIGDTSHGLEESQILKDGYTTISPIKVKLESEEKEIKTLENILKKNQ